MYLSGSKTIVGAGCRYEQNLSWAAFAVRKKLREVADRRATLDRSAKKETNAAQMRNAIFKLMITIELLPYDG